MNFWDLMRIRGQTVDARIRLEALMEADIISVEEYNEACDRFSRTWHAVRKYMQKHGYE